VWASSNYNRLTKFKRFGPKATEADYMTPDNGFLPSETHSAMVGKPVAQEGDKFLCDTCSLAIYCKYYRVGSVCAVPGSEPMNLHRYFGTRDSESIITGLGKLLTIQAGRVEEAVVAEMSDPEKKRDRDLTKEMNALFANGVKLAKLVNPALSNPKVQVQVGVVGGTAIIGQGEGDNYKQIMSDVVAELEASGWDRKDITRDVVIEYMKRSQERKALLAGETVEPHRLD